MPKKAFRKNEIDAFWSLLTLTNHIVLRKNSNDLNIFSLEPFTSIDEYLNQFPVDNPSLLCLLILGNNRLISVYSVFFSRMAINHDVDLTYDFDTKCYGQDSTHLWLNEDSRQFLKLDF